MKTRIVMDNVFIKVQDNMIGPLSEKKLRTLIEQGVFTPNDCVWSNRARDWIRAESMPGMASFFNLQGEQVAPSARLLAIASGKGGVGKTVITASMGVALASLGYNVIIVDSDFGGANLHTVMGLLQPEYSFDDFFTQRGRPLSEFLVETPIANLRMISGSCGALDLVSPQYHKKQRFIRALKSLRADFIIMDLGGGSNFNVLDFFLLADEPILVVNPELPSVQEAFGFIKVCLMRSLKRTFKDQPSALAVLNEQERNQSEMELTVEQILAKLATEGLETTLKSESAVGSFKPKLILNKAREKSDLDEAISIRVAASDLLSLQVGILGRISLDDNVARAVRHFRPFILHDPKSRAAQDLMNLIHTKILCRKGLRELLKKRRWRKQVAAITEVYPEVKLVDEVPVIEIVKAKSV
ncbi:MAG: P-loop NTPase [bacterium]